MLPAERPIGNMLYSVTMEFTVTILIWKMQSFSDKSTGTCTVINIKWLTAWYIKYEFALSQSSAKILKISPFV